MRHKTYIKRHKLGYSDVVVAFTIDGNSKSLSLIESINIDLLQYISVDVCSKNAKDTYTNLARLKKTDEKVCISEDEHTFNYDILLALTNDFAGTNPPPRGMKESHRENVVQAALSL